jgi:putative ABC transport system permease protein
MITFTIALRYLLRRKARMATIGALVFLGTVVIIFGETFCLSARHFSQASIVNYFTGDLILFSDKSKEKPSPFSFTTPLPVIGQPHDIEAWLDTNPLVGSHVAIAQNYGLMSVDTNGKKTEVPFIFYAVDPGRYRATFSNISIVNGSYFVGDSGKAAPGVVLSAFQRDIYAKNYNVRLDPGDRVTLLSLTDGGSVNAYPSKIVGIYEPKYYKNVFNYINFLDITSYARLYNFTGVDTASLPPAFNRALASGSDDEIFGLARTASFDHIDAAQLVSRELTGYTMIAVKLKESAGAAQFIESLKRPGFGVKAANWKEASGFFAGVAIIIQSVIYGATFLIFLIVVFILMNTLIIGVLERTGEIGTLRAMGGEKGFIRAMFLWESLLLNGAAAFIGMIVSLALIILLQHTGGVGLPDVMAQYLVGGGALQLLLSARPFGEAMAIVLLASTLATLYPISVAVKITPLKAMSNK